MVHVFMIAVIQTGGKQYTVQPGQTIDIEKIGGVAGDAVQFPEVLLVADDAGTALTVGTPKVAGANVVGKIVRQYRSKKIRVVKFKSKVHYRRTHGHRQHYTSVQITEVKG